MVSPDEEEPSVLVEIPLVFSTNITSTTDAPASPSLHVLHDNSIRKACPRLQNSLLPHSHEKYNKYPSAIWRGSASATPIADDVVLTTALVTEAPWILNITRLSCSKEESASPISMHLDVSSLSSYLIKVQAVVVDDGYGDKDEIVTIVLVDSQANVRQIWLNAQTLQPATSNALSWNPHQEVSTPLRSSMVTILSPHSVLLALPSRLVAVHLPTTTLQQQRQNYPAYTTWSRMECLERMRRTTTRWLTAATDWLVGTLPVVVEDMSPVAALCSCASIKNNHDDDGGGGYCFSLHADGALRCWKYDGRGQAVHVSDIHPQQQRQQQTTNHHAILPRHWLASDLYSVSITSRMTTAAATDNSYHVAVYARTTRPTEHVISANVDDPFLETNANDLSSSSPPTTCHLVWIQGILSSSESSFKLQPLQVPSQASSLISIMFDEEDNNNNSTLVTLFESPQQELFHTRYSWNDDEAQEEEKSPISVVLDSDEFLLAARGQQEYNRIQNLSLASACFPKFAKNNPATLDERLTRLDQRYLQFLFRPAFSRGTGSILPPNNIHIQRALGKLMGYSHHEQQPVAGGSSSSMPVHVIRAMHQWRQQKQLRSKSKNVLSSPPSRLPSMSIPEGMSIYESLQLFETHTEEKKECDDESGVDLDEAVFEHEHRWKLLMSEIWQQEQCERSPLCLALLPRGKEHAIVVRSGTISVIRPETTAVYGHVPAIMALLDHIAVKALRVMEMQPEAAAWASVEQRAWELVAQATLNVDELALGRLLEAIANLAGGTVLDKVLNTMDPKDCKVLLEQLRNPESDLLDLVHEAMAADPSMEMSQPSGGEDSLHHLSQQQQLAAAAVVVNNVDNFRQLALGRLVTLSALTGNSPATLAVLRTYLHAMAVMWVLKQHVDTASSSEKRCTALDSLLLNCARKLSTSNDASSFSAATVRLAGDVVHKLLHFETSNENKLPELNVTPLVPDSKFSCEPILALRVLAVHVALPSDQDSVTRVALRTKVYAECLLITALSWANNDDQISMISHALKMLSFDTADPPKSMNHAEIVCHHLKCKIEHQHILTKYMLNAIGCTRPGLAEEHTKLWSMLFECSLFAGNWKAAYEASIRTPSTGKCQKEWLARMVETMVDRGALSVLLKLCSRLGRTSPDGHRESSDLYAIAVRTLSDKGARGIYSIDTVDGEPFSDYQGALFSLHASHGQWEEAARVLEKRSSQAQMALLDTTFSTELTPKASERRASCIVNDISLAWRGCYFSMKQHGDETRGLYILKEEGIESFAFLSLAELASRAIISSSLQRIFDDKLQLGRAFAMSSFAEEVVTPETMAECLDLLFSSGFYHDGLSLALACSKWAGFSPNGSDVFSEALTHLLCTFLVPLATGRLVATKRPSFSQFVSSLEAFQKPLLEQQHHQSSILGLRRGSRLSALRAGVVRVGAEALVHALAVRYASSQSSIGVGVADCMLANNSAARLPSWLERLLLHGNSPGNEDGLFAKRRSKNDSPAYLGNGSAILTLYTKRGLYADACRLVIEVINGDSADWTDRQNKASSRLPEKGSIDFVPYNKIDLLWNLIEAAVSDSSPLHRTEKNKMIAARLNMEAALGKHFELLAISEMGLISARMIREEF